MNVLAAACFFLMVVLYNPDTLHFTAVFTQGDGKQVSERERERHWPKCRQWWTTIFSSFRTVHFVLKLKYKKLAPRQKVNQKEKD